MNSKTSTLETTSIIERDIERALAKRGKALLEAPDLAKQVADLEPLEAYFMVKELGLESAVLILLAASEEQLKAFVDLDCWTNDVISIDDLDAWLAPFAAIGPEPLVDAFLNLDEEIQHVFLRDNLLIFERLDKEGPMPGTGRDVPRLETPDDLFVLERASEDERDREVDVFALVKALYAHDMQLGYRLIMTCLHEFESGSVEDAFHFRQGRLADLGFPTPSDAASLLQAPSQTPSRTGRLFSREPWGHLPAIYARALSEGTLFANAMKRIQDEDFIAELEREWVAICNASFVAFRETPGSVAVARSMMNFVSSTLSLGLESMIRNHQPNKVEADADVLSSALMFVQNWTLRDVFRAGFSHLKELQTDTRRVLEDPVFSHWATQPDKDGDEYTQERRERAFVIGLAKARPLLCGEDAIHPKRGRPFGTLAEVHQAAAQLAEIRDNHS